MNRRTLLLAGTAATLGGCARRGSRVVLYCAQDRGFAEGVVADFTRDTGLAVVPKFDTEANKSVALAAELAAEIDRPRCDVHWNNEVLGTIRLARKGVYERYESPNATPFSATTRPADRTWQAFAGRARVLVVNTALVPNPADRPRSVLDLADPKWKGRVGMAKPAFGTTATHAAALWEVLGDVEATRFFRAVRANDVRVVAGNKPVATGVGDGRFAVGLTDTDDAMSEIAAGKTVAVVFPDRDGHPSHPRLGTAFIPNTVAVVKGGPNADGGRKLVDYLLRPETEKRLAEGGGFQFPLNPGVAATMPGELRDANGAKPMAVDWERAADGWDACLAVLRDVFGRV